MMANPEKEQSAIEKLANIRALLDSPWGENLESDRARLERRAAALAQRQNAAAPEAVITLLLFRLGGQSFGLELAVIEKVLSWRPCMSLPATPEHLLGLAEVNGEILAIMDLGRLFALPGGASEASGQIILLGRPEQRVGLRVAGLDGIRHVAARDIHPPPVSLPPAGARFLRGVTPEGVIVLDAEKLLNAPELVIGQDP